MSNNNVEKSLKVGDFVFAKLSSYRPWPAKVMATEEFKYTVYFYGTGNFGLRLNSSDIFLFSEDNKARFGKIDKSKDGFKKGMDEIECAIKGNDIGPEIENFNIEHLTNSKKKKISGSKKEENRNPLENRKEETKKTTKENQGLKNISRKSKRGIEIHRADKTDSPAPKKRLPASESTSTPNATRSPIQKKVEECIESRVKESRHADPSKHELLEFEAKLLMLIKEVKKSLAVTIDTHETDHCVRKLMEIKLDSNKITAMILKKNPNCVETIKRLKTYGGRKSDRENENFLKNAEKIRSIAKEIYNSFKCVFNIEKKVSFWLQFTEICSDFDKKTSNMSEEEKLNLVHEFEI